MHDDGSGNLISGCIRGLSILAGFVSVLGLTPEFVRRVSPWFIEKLSGFFGLEFSEYYAYFAFGFCAMAIFLVTALTVNFLLTALLIKLM